MLDGGAKGESDDLTHQPAADRLGYRHAGCGSRRRSAWRPGAWNLDRIFKLFPRLEERKSQLGRQLSGGEQEMLAIARPLLLNPRLMLLDEPSQGLAPLIVKEVMQVIKTMRSEGLSVLLIEQNVPLSLAVADRAYVLDDGKVVHSGPAAALASDKELVDKLAGAGHK
jgi:branched-chain amino acid transport system ATP-binding protein